MALQTILLAVLAVAVLGGVGLVLVRLRGLGGLAESERRALEDKLADRERRLADLEHRLAAVDAERDRLAVEAAEARARLAERDQAAAQAAQQAEALRRALDARGEALAEAQAVLAKTEETLAQERKAARDKLDTLVQARDEMTRQFKVLADEVMQRHGEAFSKTNKERMEALLHPLRERIDGFQARMNEIYQEETKGRAALEHQIKSLTALNTRMSEEANNLTKALKGQSQVQGAWGEMILERILESSGLRAGEEYVTQDSHTAEDNRRLRPDVIIRLPGGRVVIVDSKVSLTAYDRYCTAADETERDLALKQHVGSLKSHIAGLAKKDYAGVVQGSIDYVLMFIPIEGAFSAAVAADAQLTEYALSHGIGLTTPTTLTTVLRTVNHLWQVERRNQNAQKIADEAAKMYDKFVLFADDLKKVGRYLDQAHTAHGAAMNKLIDGRGNLVRKLEGLRDLGVQPKKAIDREMASDAGVGWDESEAAALPEPAGE